MFLLDFLYLSWKCEISLFSDEFSAKGKWFKNSDQNVLCLKMYISISNNESLPRNEFLKGKISYQNGGPLQHHLAGDFLIPQL